jgi:hypothetical protein
MGKHSRKSIMATHKKLGTKSWVRAVTKEPKATDPEVDGILKKGNEDESGDNNP